MEKSCLICANKFYIRPYRIKDNPRFCSSSCYGRYTKGKIRTSLIKKCLICEKEFTAFRADVLRGKSIVCSKECAKISISRKLRKYGNMTHGGIHQWVIKKKGSPFECADCGIKGKYVGNVRKKWSIEWSNKDHLYSENLSDYTARCISCHRKYDIQFNNYKNNRLKI